MFKVWFNRGLVDIEVCLIDIPASYIYPDDNERQRNNQDGCIRSDAVNICVHFS